MNDYAFKVISQLSITDSNYEVALQLLKDEFLDEKYIIDETLKQLLSSSPKFDPSFSEVRIYINECRALLHELKTYKVDLLRPGNAGCRLVSHIIFSKLPASLRRELVHKIDSNYPSVVDLFEHYNELVKTLVRTSRASDATNVSKSAGKPKWKQNKAHVQSGTAEGKDKPNKQTDSTLENFQTSSLPSQTVSNTAKGNGTEKDRYCKFCAIKGHSMLACSKYVSVDARKQRCLMLHLCSFCSSNKHDDANCPGIQKKLSFECFNCKSKSHISALCPQRNESVSSNLCLNSQHSDQDFQQYLLPVVPILFSRGKVKCKVRCLIDIGSQRSYLSQNVMNQLQNCNQSMSPVSYDLTAFWVLPRKFLMRLF